MKSLNEFHNFRVEFVASGLRIQTSSKGDLNMIAASLCRITHYIVSPGVTPFPSGHVINVTSNSLMLLDVTNRPMPMGMNMSPMMKKAGSTVPAVRMGCQAGSLCCLNAVFSGFLLRRAPPPGPVTVICPSSSLAL